MAAIQGYSQLALFLNGTYVEQKTSVEISGDSGKQRVELLNEGLGGFTMGSGAVTISWGIVCPVGGLEFDYWGMMKRDEYVVMQLPIGGATYVGTGQITTCNLSQSQGGATEGTVEWTGPLNELE